MLKYTWKLWKYCNFGTKDSRGEKGFQRRPFNRFRRPRWNRGRNAPPVLFTDLLPSKYLHHANEQPAPEYFPKSCSSILFVNRRRGSSLFFLLIVGVYNLLLIGTVWYCPLEYWLTCLFRDVRIYMHRYNTVDTYIDGYIHLCVWFWNLTLVAVGIDTNFCSE